MKERKHSYPVYTVNGLFRPMIDESVILPVHHLPYYPHINSNKEKKLIKFQQNGGEL